MELAFEWSIRAACRGGDTDVFFLVGAAQHAAKRICQDCAVRYECLAEALDDRIEWGVWGGLTESERRNLMRRYPGVTDWRRLFSAARAAAQIDADMAARGRRAAYDRTRRHREPSVDREVADARQ